MGKKSTPKMPDLPDVNQMIDKQAEVNRTDFQNVMGGTTWEEGADGKWTQSQNYSPLGQALLKMQMQGALKSPDKFSSGGPSPAFQQMYQNISSQAMGPGNYAPTSPTMNEAPQPDVASLLNNSMPKPQEKPQPQQQQNPNIAMLMRKLGRTM